MLLCYILLAPKGQNTVLCRPVQLFVIAVRQ